MEIIAKQGDPNIAQVFVAKFRGSNELMAEFVDARDPDLPANEKWVIIVSTQFGCPILCKMCDAGGDYRGDMSADEIMAQIEYAVSLHDKARLSSVRKFKIQFARMGEPSLNSAVLNVLRELPCCFDTPALIPCIATIAPRSALGWFESLLAIRRDVYRNLPFQLQFSINSTDDAMRDMLMPTPKLTFNELGKYAKVFTAYGPRKVSLNFVLMRNIPVLPHVVARHFTPDCACIKITPLNPTLRSGEQGLESAFSLHAKEDAEKIANEFKKLGFEVVLSIGDIRENTIGSNCGMAVRKMRGEK